MNSPLDKPGRYFTWGEFERTRQPIANTLPPSLRPNVVYLVATLLDPLREDLGRPVVVTSGYRCDAVNRAVGGSPTSRHKLGQAADIVVPPHRGLRALTSFEVLRRILALGLPFDQCVAYVPERGGHLHTGVHDGPLRKQLLQAPAAGGYLRWTP